LNGSATGWTGNNLIKGALCISKTFSSIANTSPFTWVYVLDGLDLDIGINNFLMNMLNIRLQYAAGNVVFFQLNGASGFSRRTYSGTKTAGLKLMVATYDGSQSRNGLELYINDMNTPLTPSATAGVVNAGAANVTNVANNTTNTLIHESHLFQINADSTQRTAIKEILEQRYTFT
jgi:hypothetical protein